MEINSHYRRRAWGTIGILPRVRRASEREVNPTVNPTYEDPGRAVEQQRHRPQEKK